VTGGNSSFKVGIDFESVLRAISKQIYETPLAFIRENVQNAVDAVRIQALRENADPGDRKYGVDITVDGKRVIVRDNGIGMTGADLQNYFWTIGASGKRNSEAIAAGCVGMFGIGGFANFGVCDALEVISQVQDAEHGYLKPTSKRPARPSRP
jgi:molecular chaperone HtpG